MSLEFNPHEYQMQAVSHILSTPRCGLFLEMGLGKTAITLIAIRQLLDDMSIDRVLVAAPPRVAKETWAQEAAKWRQTEGLAIVPVLGTPSQREAAIRQDGDIYLASRDNLPWLKEASERLGRRYDMIVIDESSGFKSQSTRRWKVMSAMSKAAKRVVLLTGTPRPNTLMDLWAQIYLLDRGERLCRSMSRYRQAYFVATRYAGNHIPVEFAPKSGAEDAILQKVSELCLSMRAEDYLQLPDRIVIDQSVELPDEAMTIYRRMQREHLIRLDEQEIHGANAAVVVQKLLQLANGFAYDAERGDHAFDESKLQALEQLAESAAGEPMLVYYLFRADRQRILDRIPGAEDLDVERWCRGGQIVALAHPASAGYGLNLQSGGHIIVWFGLSWSYEQYEQANARIHRQGQTMPVRVYRLIAKNTADELVAAALERKSAGSAYLMESLRGLREREMD